MLSLPALVTLKLLKALQTILRCQTEQNRNLALPVTAQADQKSASAFLFSVETPALS